MSLRKFDRMYSLYGRKPGLKCKDCCSFVSGRYHDKILYKCERYGLTHSEASDWAGRWEACGQYNVPFTGTRPVIDLFRGVRDKQEKLPPEEQTRLF